MEIRYLKCPLSRTFSSGPLTLTVTAFINLFGISSTAVSSFHYVELFSPSLQRFLGVFPIRCLDHFHFTHSHVESTHLKTLIKCLSFLILTQQHISQAKT